MTFQEIALEDVRRERAAQDRKWGADRELSDHVWDSILMEEVGEVAEAGLESTAAPMEAHGKFWRLRLYDELKQVAAVAVARMEALMRSGDVRVLTEESAEDTYALFAMIDENRHPHVHIVTSGSDKTICGIPTDSLEVWEPAPADPRESGCRLCREHFNRRGP